MRVLGINAYHAEASAALIAEGQLIAAAEEERFVRTKHVAGFPKEAVRYCLEAGGIRPEDLDAIAVSRSPSAHLWARGWAALRRGPTSPAVRSRLENLARIRSIHSTVAETLGIDPHRLKAKVYFVEHHRAHIASSFYPSGWEKAVVVSLDGFGDFLSGMWGVGQGLDLRIDGGIAFPHSLGILYTAITQFLGFTSWGDEYKVMGLAAYGDPRHYRRAMEQLVQETRGGLYRLNLDYFRHHQMDVSMTWAAGAPTLSPLFTSRMQDLLGPSRNPKDSLEERHAHISAALQERLEALVLAWMRRLAARYSTPRLCYAGGVALNCALNGNIFRETPFRQAFVQPAAHDAGTSLGAALYVTHHLHRQPRRFVMNHAAWGPDPQESKCRTALEAARIPYRRLGQEILCETSAQALSQGRIVGWFQGRMEFGPRSLGHRSLLADPRDAGMKERINERVKRRESFRPFAPALPVESVPLYFPQGHSDPFMLFAYPVDPSVKDQIPAVIHADGTGRLQAVSEETEPLFWKLLKRFEVKTGVPVLLNTSFNEQEPIVCRPEEAIACFQRNAIDCLALGPFWVERSNTP